jgi:hypothetical protein
MVNTIHQLSVVASSPNDESSAREIVAKVIQRIDRTLELMDKPYRLVFKDQKAVRPEAGNPQSVADKQLQISACYIFIGILGLRFGSEPGLHRASDGTPYLSGTEKEIEDAFAANNANGGKRPSIMLYRRNVSTPSAMTDEQVKQYSRVIDFFEKCRANQKHPAFYYTFEPAELEQKLEDHILQACMEHEDEWLNENISEGN